MEGKNEYEKKSRKNSLLGAITETQETKGDIKGSAIETGKDLLVGVIGGGAVGSLLGRSSLLVGLAVTGMGHYSKNRLATIFGFGMMAANGFQPKKDAVSGTGEKSLVEGAKERLMTFKDTFSEKLFLDKLKKKKDTPSTDNSTAGMGEVQYFSYPSNQLGAGEVDLTALDELERQVERSAENFQLRQQEMKGILPSDQTMGAGLDPSDKNY